MNRKILFSLLAVGTVITIANASTNSVRANEDTSKHGLFVGHLAQNFDLNKSDIEAILDAINDESNYNFQLNFQDRLDQLVADNTITKAQKHALLQKRQEFVDLSTLPKNQTGKSNNQKRKHAELVAWANNKNIDLNVTKSYSTSFSDEFLG